MTSERTHWWLSPLVAAAVLVEWLEVGVDAVHRNWDGVARAPHFAAALLLFTAAGTLFAGLVALAVRAYQGIAARLAPRFPRAATWLPPAAGALVTMGASASTAFWTFSADRMRGTALAVAGPWVLIALAGAFGAGVVALFGLVRAAAQAGRRRALVTAAALFALAAVLVRIDLTVYVSLYARLHTLLESCAAGCACAATFLVLVFLIRGRPRVVRATNVFAVVAGGVTALFVVIEPARAWVDESLRHAWREPIYVGRMLSRMQIVEGFVRDPRGWRGATMSSVVTLRERYDIATTSRSPAWDKPLAEPPWLKQRIDALRGKGTRNIIIFYVDTLRADVERDPRVMPNTIRFASTAIDFRNAYTTGSDTLHALPGLTGGSYDLFTEQPNDLLRVMHGAGYHSVLMVAQSAHEFLSKLLPQFKFDETVDVPDYSPGNENVWGYGADQPTAARIVDRSLDWLHDHAGKPFVMWMFNFDVHNWRELDEAYARDVGKKNHLYDEADPVWRYRVAAREVDAQFGRFLGGLRDLGIADDTVLLFLSDHGEGLGREGFWVHSVFLWQALIHVPLILRVPGVPPAVVNDVVSLVDVAPTLSRFMVPDADTQGYQGEDLLSYLVPNHPPRRLPLVLMGTLKEVPVRLGIIDPKARFKLVLPLEGAVPELYDLRAADPDERDVSGTHGRETLKLLNELVRAPLFPRLNEKGSGPLDQAAADGKTAIEIESQKKAEEKANASAGVAGAEKIAK